MTSTIIEPVKSTKALRTISYARSSGLIGICLLALGAQSVKASGEKTPALMDQQSQCLWRRRPHLSFFQKIPRRRGDIEASLGIKSVAQQMSARPSCQNTTAQKLATKARSWAQSVHT
jgi:hypothetical protein